MFNIFIAVGLNRSLGILMTILKEVFEESYTKVSLIFTSAVAGYCTCALLYVFGIGQIFHERALVLVSGLIGSVSFFLASFYTGLEGFYVAAFCVGVMEQVSMSSSLGIVGKYFQKRLSIGYGIAMSGVSLGTLALIPVVYFLYDEYTFRGARIIIAGFILNTFVCAALMRPARTSKFSITQETCNIQEQQISSNTHEEHLTYATREDDNGESGLSEVVGVSVKDMTTPVLCRARKDTISKYLVVKEGFGETSEATTGHVEIDYRVTEVPTSSNALTALKQFVFVNVEDKPKRASLMQTVFGGLVFFKTASFCFYQLFAFLSMFGCECLIQFFILGLYSGTPPYHIGFLLSIIYGSDFVARILIGCLGDYVNRDILVLVPQLVLALICFLAKYATETWSHIVLALSIGLAYGTTYSFRGVGLIDYFGLEHLSQLLGITNFVGSLGFTVGYPLLYNLIDVTVSYQTTLHILGGLFISSFLSFGMVVVIKLCGRVKKKSDDLS